MGPLEATKPWSMEGVNGVRGFLGRVWRMIVDDHAETMAAQRGRRRRRRRPTSRHRVLHKTIKAVTEDIEQLSFNTAIARMMEFTNYFTKQDRRPRAAMEPFVLLLSPFAPHIAEELWAAWATRETLAYEPWPQYDESLLVEATVELPVQINGKLRGKIVVPADADERRRARRRPMPKIAEQLAGKTIVMEKYVAGPAGQFRQ